MDRKTTPESGTRANGLLHPGDASAALMLLSRVPVPENLSSTRGARSAWAWPLVGALLAALSWAAGAAALLFGLPPVVAAGFAVGAGTVLTGALHEDGLADCADGFWGGGTRERRLEILRDSRIGSYGVIALVLALGMRWAALALLFEAGYAAAALIAAGMLSRAGMAALMWRLPFAREDGLAVRVGRPPGTTAVLAGAVSLACAIFALGGAGIGAAVSALLATTAVAALARAKLGGQTGDVLGAAQQAAETAVLLTCLAILT
jgi:adenosylcobinamide-GDP ribazoletransferase